MLRDFRAYQLAKEFYKGCKRLRLPRHLQDQVFRASSSIVLNIAEGSGKQTGHEQRRFYGIALGSLRECQAVLEMEDIDTPHLHNLMDQLGAILFKRCRNQNPREAARRKRQTENPQTSNNKLQAPISKLQNPNRNGSGDRSRN